MEQPLLSTFCKFATWILKQNSREARAARALSFIALVLWACALLAYTVRVCRHACFSADDHPPKTREAKYDPAEVEEDQGEKLCAALGLRAGGDGDDEGEFVADDPLMPTEAHGDRSGVLAGKGRALRQPSLSKRAGGPPTEVPNWRPYAASVLPAAASQDFLLLSVKDAAAAQAAPEVQVGAEGSDAKEIAREKRTGTAANGAKRACIETV